MKEAGCADCAAVFDWCSRENRKGENAVFDIEEELKKLPAQPGVYLMHDKRDEII